MVGDSPTILKFENQANYVNGLKIEGFCVQNESLKEILNQKNYFVTNDYSHLLIKVDAVYILATPQKHYALIKQALESGKHVLCESPITLSSKESQELMKLAKDKKLVLMEGLKTAHSTAYHRLMLLAKGGIIGKIVSVDATCTSLSKNDYEIDDNGLWNSICAWGPTCLLPIFQILGTKYTKKEMVSFMIDSKRKMDGFTKVMFTFENAIASLKVGKSVKSEGELIISGTKGCIYVPAPWWKTDYFEIHYENIGENRRFFYQLDGEGIRNELVEFVNQIEKKLFKSIIEEDISLAISQIIEDFYSEKYDEIHID
ncbi:MAG: Gfo/Idh/MocA family oxidoreductase [Anaeroplasma bactoclasticum]|nr:Gfo/Idh/MocA family oxidoreductase [Anaeroplasma bactoclasticum]MCM1557385.1 Gfo/Idh/MocA family oxidoreductase [Anaeroplasma bactoclasticum]